MTSLKHHKSFAILFILTGIFAILGGLYTWGEGSIFAQTQLIKVLIPWADIIFTGPLSILVGIGLLKHKTWASKLALSLSGIYIFGSLLVYIDIFWNQNFSIYLIIPATSGFSIALYYILTILSNKN